MTRPRIEPWSPGPLANSNNVVVLFQVLIHRREAIVGYVLTDMKRLIMQVNVENWYTRNTRRGMAGWKR